MREAYKKKKKPQLTRAMKLKTRWNKKWWDTVRIDLQELNPGSNNTITYKLIQIRKAQIREAHISVLEFLFSSENKIPIIWLKLDIKT